MYNELKKKGETKTEKEMQGIPNTTGATCLINGIYANVDILRSKGNRDNISSEMKR